mgnify:CR=1 FL=1
MTTEDSTPDTKVPDAERAERLTANLAKVEELSKRLTAALTHRRQVDPSLHGPAPDVYMKAAAEIGRPVRGNDYGVNHGYWTTEFGPLNQVWHLWSYESMAERDRLRAELARVKMERDILGKATAYFAKAAK